jgi:adenylosuccinate lyase
MRLCRIQAADHRRTRLLLGLVKNFSEADAAAIKEIEKTTNHDVKAVEYWIKSKFEARPELKKHGQRIRALCLHQRRHQQHQPRPATALGGATRCCCRALDRIMLKLREMAHAFADVPMLSRTHGQTASPTTVGKEMANVVDAPAGRLRPHRRRQDPGQDERRRGQLQRPPVGLARL